MAADNARIIQAERKVTAASLLVRWETVLVVLFALVNIMNIGISPNYLNAYNLFTSVNSFLTKGLVALPMAYVLLIGEIDISVGSIVCLSATVLGVIYNLSGSIVLAIVCGVSVAVLCGFINGLLLVSFQELPSMIVTLSTMVLYRGLSERILGDTSTKGMRSVKWFAQIYDARLGSVPYVFIAFVLLALAFGYVMHKTSFGRRMYAIGSNTAASRYAGVKVQKMRLQIFTLMGFMSGLSAIVYCSWMGSVKSNIADGYEMEAICMCVLGGFSTAGGKGNFFGVVISIFIIGLLRYGLGLVNVNAQKIRIIIGLLLIIVVLLPRLRLLFRRKPSIQG